MANDPLEKVRKALHEAGNGLSRPEWKALLEEIGADVDGHLDAIREEEENEESGDGE